MPFRKIFICNILLVIPALAAKLPLMHLCLWISENAFVTQVNEINEKILQLNELIETVEGGTLSKLIKDTNDEPPGGSPANDDDGLSLTEEQINAIPRQGELIVDATAYPQDISYSTDLNLLNDAREKSEELIDVLCRIKKGIAKPQTYREVARKQYLQVAQKKNKTKKEIRQLLKYNCPVYIGT